MSFAIWCCALLGLVCLIGGLIANFCLPDNGIAAENQAGFGMLALVIGFVLLFVTFLLGLIHSI